MPKKVERCVKALKKKGVPEDDAWAICQAQHGEKSELSRSEARRLKVQKMDDDAR